MSPPPKGYLLSIDNGTQSVRAMLFDSRGELLAKHSIALDPYFSTQPGWAEQRAEYFWQSLCDACQGLWPQLEIAREQITAVSVTTQRATAVALDAAGDPLRPAFSWLDQRKVDSRPALGRLESLAMRALGVKSSVDAFHQSAESNWLAQFEPDNWAATAHYLLLSGYHVQRLTGCYSDAVASQVGYLPFDFKRQRWADERDWTWRALPIERQMLPELVAAAGLLGNITAEACEQTGIPEGLPLIASGSDKACEVLGSGCVESNTGSLSFGSLATFNVTSNRYFEAISAHPAYPGVVPNSFNIETVVQRGYWMVSWFKREFGLREQQLAAERGVTPEALFDDLLDAVPAGSTGLMLQPYWSPSADDTAGVARGAIIGFTEQHSRAHLYRAMIEGLTYALREGMEQVEKRSGQRIQRLVASGGGSQSDSILQITADIFGLPVSRPHTFESSGLGAAIAAAVGAGLYPDFNHAAANMTRTSKTFYPDPANHATYQQLYRQVYQNLYRQLQPSYKKLQTLIGR